MILVVDHAHSAVCGIHDLGLRIVDNLARACLDVAHADCGSLTDYYAAVEQHAPDSVIVNFRPDLMPWWRPIPGPLRVAVVHNYEPATIGYVADGILAAGFDHVLVCDPSLQFEHPRVHVVGRPIPEAAPHRRHGDVPQIGSFGFAFPHKGFVEVAAEIADQLDEAVYNLHVPEAFFNGVEGAPLYRPGILDRCLDAIAAKPDIVIDVEVEHLPEREVVARLAANDVNCLFYVPGQPNAGLSSALDFLIAARRPALVSAASMFRHGLGHCPVWPDIRLGQVLADHDFWQHEADVLYHETVGMFAVGVAAVLGDAL